MDSIDIKNPAFPASATGKLYLRSVGDDATSYQGNQKSCVIVIPARIGAVYAPASR